MRTKHLIALAMASLLASTAAQAAPSQANLGTLSMSTPTSFSGVVTGAFTDIFSFVLPSGAGGVGGVATGLDFSILLGGLSFTSDVTVSRVEVAGAGGGSPWIDVTPENGFSFSGLMGGQSYTMTLFGDVTGNIGGGSYGGALQAAPVPEPSALLLAVAGLGMAAVMRRRRQQR